MYNIESVHKIKWFLQLVSFVYIHKDVFTGSLHEDIF
jgi:hypothetical protein